MRFLPLILFLAILLGFSEAFAQGDPITKIKGQLDTSATVGTKIVMPGLMTRTTEGILINTNAFNPLADAGMEGTATATAWTIANGTPTQDGTNKHSGKYGLAISYSAQSPTLTQFVTTNASQLTGTQGVATIWVKTTDTLVQACSYVDSAIQNCVAVASDGKWREYAVPFVFGSTNYGIQVKTSSSSTGTFYADDGFAGTMPATMTPDVAPTYFGSSYWASASGASQSANTATLAAMGTTAAIPGPTIVGSNFPGAWSTTDANNLKQTIANVPAGICEATFTSVAAASTSSNNSFAVFDGTTLGPENGANTTTSTQNVTIKATYVYTSPGTRTYEVYGRASSGTVSLFSDTGTSTAKNTQFSLACWPPSNKIYSQQSLGWFIDATINGTTSDTLSSTSSFIAYEGSTTDWTLTVSSAKGSAPAQIGCSSTNSPGTGSPSTCAAGNGQAAVVFTNPYPGPYLVCGSRSLYVTAGQTVQDDWQETLPNSQSIVQSGGETASSVTAGGTGQAFGHERCGVFNFTDVKQRALRLMYKSDGATPQLIMGALASMSNRAIHVRITPLISLEQVTASFKGTPKVPGTSSPYMYWAQLNCDTASVISSQVGGSDGANWITSIGNISSGSCALTIATQCTNSAKMTFVSSWNTDIGTGADSRITQWITNSLTSVTMNNDVTASAATTADQGVLLICY